MALDGLVVRAVVRELQAVVGGRISKIYQPTQHDIVMQLRSSSGNGKLLLSANPTYPRVHMTEAQFHNPTEPPMFCMLLRKYCEGGVIEAVEQIGNERIIRIQIRQRDELGDVNAKLLVVELMGRHSNIILMDPTTNTISDGIHHVTPSISAYRVVLPGSRYVAPPDQDKQNPFETDRDSFLTALAAASAEDLAPFLVDRYSGISPLTAREIVHRSQRQAVNRESGASGGELWAAFDSVISSAARHDYAPAIKRDTRTNRLFFSVIELTHLTGEEERFASVSACLEQFYGEKAERDAVRQRTADLHRFLQNEKNKNVKKLEKLRETLEDAKDAERVRILGELLTASLHTVKKGDKKVEVVNYYDEEQKTVTIELDPLLTPSENSQRYFKKYTKMKNSLSAVQEQIETAGEEIRYLESLLQQLSTASLADIEEIREELVEQGYIRDRRKRQAKKKKKDRPTLTLYTSSEGIAVYVGKNNLQNEYLTNRLAQPGDTWLHTKDIPGSHVVIRSAEYGEDTLLEAAQLAAYYSQARESSSVPVDYTLIRHVRKPAGAKPGFVIYDRQKTLYVTPDEKLVKNMKELTQKS